MRAVVQRVKKAAVSSEGTPCGEIEQGLVVFLGVTHTDTEKDAAYLAKKSLICGFLRIMRASSIYR